MIGLVVVPAIIFVIIEVRIVKAFPFMGLVFQRGRPLLGAAFLALLAVTGNLFTTAALLIITSGVLATLIVQPWYVLKGVGSRGFGLLDNISEQARTHRKDTERHAKQVAVVAKSTWAVGKIPFVVVLSTMDFVELSVRKFNVAFPKGGKTAVGATMTTPGIVVGEGANVIMTSTRRFRRWVARNVRNLTGAFLGVGLIAMMGWYFKLFLDVMFAMFVATPVVFWGTVGLVVVGMAAILIAFFYLAFSTGSVDG